MPSLFLTSFTRLVLHAGEEESNRFFIDQYKLRLKKILLNIKILIFRYTKFSHTDSETSTAWIYSCLIVRFRLIIYSNRPRRQFGREPEKPGKAQDYRHNVDNRLPHLIKCISSISEFQVMTSCSRGRHQNLSDNWAILAIKLFNLQFMNRDKFDIY